MARRALKPLTPLLVALVAIVLGFLAVGPSFAGTGDVPPSDGPIPASTTSVSATPQVPVAPSAVPSQTVLPEERVPTGPPAPKPKSPKTVEPSSMACASCMAPPGS